METQHKTAIEIIQELIAIHTTRKEVADKLIAIMDSDAEKKLLLSTKIQSDEFIGQLLPELANFGDAVQDGSPRDNEYQLAWKNAGHPESIRPEEATGIFQNLENMLKRVYGQLAGNEKELPASLAKLITAQHQKLH
jgi:hypothetical protein